MDLNLGQVPPRQLKVAYTGEKWKWNRPNNMQAQSDTHTHTCEHMHTHTENTGDMKPFTSFHKPFTAWPCLCLYRWTHQATTHTHHGACLITHQETHMFSHIHTTMTRTVATPPTRLQGIGVYTCARHSLTKQMFPDGWVVATVCFVVMHSTLLMSVTW